MLFNCSWHTQKEQNPVFLNTATLVSATSPVHSFRKQQLLGWPWFRSSFWWARVEERESLILIVAGSQVQCRKPNRSHRQGLLSGWRPTRCAESVMRGRATKKKQLLQILQTICVNDRQVFALSTSICKSSEGLAKLRTVKNIPLDRHKRLPAFIYEQWNLKIKKQKAMDLLWNHHQALGSDHSIYELAESWSYLMSIMLFSHLVWSLPPSPAGLFSYCIIRLRTFASSMWITLLSTSGSCLPLYLL